MIYFSDSKLGVATNVTVSGCDSSPCILKKGSSIKITVDFVSRKYKSSCSLLSEKREIEEPTSNPNCIRHIQLRANILGKFMNPYWPPRYGLNSGGFMLQNYSCLPKIVNAKCIRNYSYNPKYISVLNNS